MRAVLDANVLISSAISQDGAPARLVRAWRGGHFDLIVSPRLMAEMERALGYRKVRAHIDADEARALLDRLARNAELTPDPEDPAPMHSPDPGDDYLIALAASEDCFLVTGDSALLALRHHAPILTPVEFLELLDDDRPG